MRLSNREIEEMSAMEKMVIRHKDNLFSADHRNEMIRQYGFTDAEFIKIIEGELYYEF